MDSKLGHYPYLVGQILTSDLMAQASLGERIDEAIRIADLVQTRMQWPGATWVEVKKKAEEGAKPVQREIIP